ncbi:MAG: hypothetical protein WC624_00240 [Candidatus Margulisiibacteriota bacterium]
MKTADFSWAAISRPAAFKLLRPNPRLLKQAMPAPSGNLQARMNEFFHEQVSEARFMITGRQQGLRTLVFGPNRFDDFPLVDFLKTGYVFGVDINLTAMSEAKNALPSDLRKKLAPLNLDASLFANRIINSASGIVEKYPELTPGLLDDLIETLKAIKAEGNLPFNDNSMDMAVSISCIGQFLAFAYNSVLSMLQERYGQPAVFRLLSGIVREKKEVRNTSLNRVMNVLFRRIATSHLKETARIVRPGGVIFVSDHFFKFNSTTFRPEDLYPADLQCMSDIYLETDLPQLEVKIGEQAEGIAGISGRDSLEAALETAGNLEILESFYAWNVNFAGNAMLGVPGEYFLDAAMILSPEK